MNSIPSHSDKEGNFKQVSLPPKRNQGRTILLGFLFFTFLTLFFPVGCTVAMASPITIPFWLVFALLFDFRQRRYLVIWNWLTAVSLYQITFIVVAWGVGGELIPPALIIWALLLVMLMLYKWRNLNTTEPAKISRNPIILLKALFTLTIWGLIVVYLLVGWFNSHQPEPLQQHHRTRFLTSTYWIF